MPKKMKGLIKKLAKIIKNKTVLGKKCTKKYLLRLEIIKKPTKRGRYYIDFLKIKCSNSITVAMYVYCGEVRMPCNVSGERSEDIT